MQFQPTPNETCIYGLSVYTMLQAACITPPAMPACDAAGLLFTSQLCADPPVPLLLAVFVSAQCCRAGSCPSV